eukprot:jgi/Galph1/5935/GphlegSOOS_G4616.1
MDRLQDFVLHLDALLRACACDVTHGFPADFPVNLDSSANELDLDAVARSFIQSAKNMDWYISSLLEVEIPKAVRLEQKLKAAEEKLREVQNIITDVQNELKTLDEELTKSLENNKYNI